MSRLRIETGDGQIQFRPGEAITGTVSWTLDDPPQALELRLFWYTRGKGTEEMSVVRTVRFDHPGQDDRRPFQLQSPEAPYSFSGKLISLLWALELVALPSEEAEQLDITMSPTGEEIFLHK